MAFLLEPDLKEGRGGLRDVHALGGRPRRAASCSSRTTPSPRRRLRHAARRPGRAAPPHRPAHRRARAPGAGRRGRGARRWPTPTPSCEACPARPARSPGRATTRGAASRSVLRRSRSAGGRGATSDLGAGLVLRDGEVHVAADADRGRPTRRSRCGPRPLAASHDTVIDRGSLDRLAAEAPPAARPVARRGPQPPGRAAARRAARHRRDRGARPAGPLGPGAAGVGAHAVAAAAQRLPPLHRRPAPGGGGRQRGRAGRTGCDRPDLLVVGALLHDIGKGRPGDHTEVGMELVRDIGARMGFPAADVDTLVAMVEHHLLLPDVATRPRPRRPRHHRHGRQGRRRRRYPSTCWPRSPRPTRSPPARRRGARGRPSSSPTSSSARPTCWPADRSPTCRATSSPSAEHLALMADGTSRCSTGATTCSPWSPSTGPGVFSRWPACSPCTASACSTPPPTAPTTGVALGPLPGRVELRAGRAVGPRHRATSSGPSPGASPSPPGSHDRARTYARGVRPRPRRCAPASPSTTGPRPTATVIDVHAPDSIGLLHRITRALAELDLDIRSAKVSDHRPTGRRRVLRARPPTGEKLTDEPLQREVERAILHATREA